MRKAYLFISSLVMTCMGISASAQILISGTPYTNLTYAFAAINAGTHTGAVLIELNGSFSEGPGVATLNGSGVGAANYTSVTIRAMADNIVIDGSAQAVIHLKGADNVTFDGNNTASTAAQQDVTIRNTAYGSGNTVVWITSSGALNAATNNVFRHCIIEGVSASECQYGILGGGNGSIGAAAAAANNNNTVDSNIVHKCQSGIVAVGGVLSQDIGWRIRGNRIGSNVSGEECGYEGISAVNVVTITITDNVIAGIYGDISQPVKGINLGQTVQNSTIARNKIHNIGNLEFMVGYGAAGIFFNSISTSSDNRIYNNEIYGIESYGNQTGAAVDNNSYGIALAQGGDFNIWHNTVYMNTYPEVDAPSAALFIAAGVAPGSVTLMNNILMNTNTLATDTSYAVYNLATAVFAAIDYNLYYSDGLNLNFTGGNPVPDLATWKGLTLRDTGSVNAFLPMTFSGDDLMVNNAIDSCWFANGRAITAPAAYQQDITMTMRNTNVGQPSDIGSREFTPATGVLPPDAVASAAPANNTTTSYWSGGHKVCEIAWGPNGTVPANVAVKYYSGEFPPCWGNGFHTSSYVNIAETGGSGYDFNINMIYTAAENNGHADGMLRIVRDSAVLCNWANVGGLFSGTDPSGRVISPSNPLNDVGNFTLGDVPLGLELLSFDAKNNGSVNDISWNTASEENMKNFDVLRSNDGVNFSSLGSVACKNGAISNTYSFRDMAPKAGYNYYRLKINENNGHSSYSNIVAVKNGGGSSIDVIAVHPNPATAQVVVGIYSTEADQLNITVTDITGRTVLAHQQQIGAGDTNITLNISELSTGLYTVKATRAAGGSSTTKLMKQ